MWIFIGMAVFASVFAFALACCIVAGDETDCGDYAKVESTYAEPEEKHGAGWSLH